MKQKKVCLASGSISRKILLENVNIDFEIRIADIDESYNDDTPRDYVKRLAYEKAKAVSEITESNLIIAADSVAIREGRIYGKPKDTEDGIKMISELQGSEHQFITGYCVLDKQSNESIIDIEETIVSLIKMNNEEIREYIDKIKPFRFAGGYSTIESNWIIESINGSISNIMGLPMSSIKKSIEMLNYNWFELMKE